MHRRSFCFIEFSTSARPSYFRIGVSASVRWLSNEQTYWDGARIWTYDFPNDQVQAIAIDPRQVAVTRTIGGLGKGPGPSLVVLPHKKKGPINVAGGNLIAFLDLEHGS